MRTLLTSLFVLSCVVSGAYTQDWGPMATISSTMGINAGRLCIGEASRGDIGCPTYAPSVTAAGHVSITGSVSAAKFLGDGSGLTGVASSGDRITSSTTSVTANSTGFISLTTAGTTTGYFTTAGLLVLPGISTTTLHGISSTNGYFNGRVGIGTHNPSTSLHVSGTMALTDALLLPYSTPVNTVQATYDKLRAVYPADSGALVLADARDIGLSNQEIVLLKADGETNNDDGFSIVQWNSGGLSHVPFRMLGNGRLGLGGILTPSQTLDVSGTVRATNFIGNGSGLTGLSGDNLGNHTATQNLGLGDNAIVFSNTSNVDKIYYYSNTYGVGVEPSTLSQWIPTSARFVWRHGGTSYSTGTERMSLGNSGLIVTGYISTTGVIDAGRAIYGYAGDSVTAPGYTWSGDTNTGMYWVGADQLGLTVGGIQQVLVRPAGIVVSGSILANNVGDSATAPSFSWSGDTNTGFYWVASDQIGVTTGGGQRALFSSGGLKVTGTVTTTGIIDAGSYIYGYPGDSAAAPGYTWSGDNNTGMFNAAGDIIGFSAGGTDRFRVTSSGISTTGNISLHTGGTIFGDNGDTNYTSGLFLYSGKDANTGAYISLYGVDHSSAAGRVAYVAVSDTAGAMLHRFYSRTTAGANSTILSLYQGGDAILTGDMTAAAFLYSSDKVLKTHIQPSPGLKLVRNLNGRVFDWKATGKHASGVIAQEVEQVMPHIVKMGKEGTKVVDYPQLIAPLIEAVKDLDHENKRLKTQLEDLDARLRKLEAR